MKNSTLETESNDKEVITYVLKLLHAASNRAETVLETLDQISQIPKTLIPTSHEDTEEIA